MLDRLGSIQSLLSARVPLNEPAFREWTVSDAPSATSQQLELVDCQLVPYEATYVSRVVSSLVGASADEKHHEIEVQYG